MKELLHDGLGIWLRAYYTKVSSTDQVFTNYEFSYDEAVNISTFVQITAQTTLLKIVE